MGGLGKILRKGSKYLEELKEEKEYTKKVKEAKNLEKIREEKETELEGLTEKARKSRDEKLEGIRKAGELRKEFDTDWGTKLNNAVSGVTAYLILFPNLYQILF